MSRQDNTLEVWLDDDLGPARQVGTLAHDRGQIRFHYERDRSSRRWIARRAWCALFHPDSATPVAHRTDGRSIRSTSVPRPECCGRNDGVLIRQRQQVVVVSHQVIGVRSR